MMLGRLFLPRTVLHRRRQPDPFVVFLQLALPHDLLSLAHSRVPRFGRPAEVADVEVRGRDQASDLALAARAAGQGGVTDALPDLVDHATGLAFELVDGHQTATTLGVSSSAAEPAAFRFQMRAALSPNTLALISGVSFG